MSFVFPAPIDGTAALTQDLGCLLVSVLMALTLDRSRLIDRLLFGAVVTVLMLSYVAWRLSDTVPALDFTLSTIWPILFVSLEMLSIAYSLGSVLILLRASEPKVRRAADAAEAAMRSLGDWPAVDVFICTYNEPLSVLEKSLLAAQAIEYPGVVTVWVLDDTRRAALKAYCDEVGVRYLMRADNDHAKAGNLNNGLHQSASVTGAPYILVLDADFAPQRHILTRTIGLFRDRRIGVVQTPQFYFNPDPVQHNLNASAHWVDDQRVFFDVFQPARDAWDCAFCVGTSFVVRRDVLDQMGGFPTGAVCEDIWLSYSLLRLGYVTRWLNERLSIGLSAEGIAEYVTQRARWCLGTVQVALLRDGPFRGSGYRLRHRLMYAHGLLYWVCKPFLVAMLAAPAIYWLFGLPAMHADYLAFLGYGVPPLIAFWIWSAWSTDGRSLPLLTEVTHTVVAIPISIAVVSALIRPFGRPFKVTPKGNLRDRLVIDWRLGWPFLASVAITAASVIWFLVEPDKPVELPPEDILNLGWACVSMVVSLACFLVCCERPRARDERFPVGLESRARTASGVEFPCVIEALSERGATVRADLPFRDGEMVEVMVPSIGWAPCRLGGRLKGGRTDLIFDLAPASHRRMVAWLYSDAPENIARCGNMAGAIWGLTRRVLSP